MAPIQYQGIDIKGTGPSKAIGLLQFDGANSMVPIQWQSIAPTGIKGTGPSRAIGLLQFDGANSMVPI
eukprot:476481-Ditylum_brightwellii.AAC.1